MAKQLKFAVFIIAYEAVKTFVSAYERIPNQIKKEAFDIYVFDDASTDNTYLAAIGYKYLNKIKKLNIYRNKVNLVYGGNQKKGYKYAINKGYDVVVMLHADAQYAPEKLPEIIKPFKRNPEIAMVFGSRMLGNPLEGGMPIYKFLGNKILTFLENLILRTNFSEFHSGYRAYNCNVLKKIPFEKLSNDFHFDTEIIIQLVSKNYKIVEVPIPTHYGDEKSHVNVIKYGINCLFAVINYRLLQIPLIKRKFLNGHEIYRKARQI